jgi:HEAT repeat protein
VSSASTAALVAAEPKRGAPAAAPPEARPSRAPEPGARITLSSEQETGDLDLERLKKSALVTKPGELSDSKTQTFASMLDATTPEAYDQLVSDFLHAAQGAAREQIAARLEEDSSSDDSAIRYYAVEAMSKLGREVFGDALLAATEDENEAVRAIAVEALRR